VHYYLGIQCLFNTGSSLDLGLSPVYLCHDAVNVLQFMTPFPEYSAVLHDLIWSLSLHILSDVINVISSILLIGLDKLIEITLRPICETLVNEVKNGKHETIHSLSKQQFENT
jgi:hypothetical protein